MKTEHLFIQSGICSFRLFATERYCLETVEPAGKDRADHADASRQETGTGAGERFAGSLFQTVPVSGYFMGWKLFTGIPDADRVEYVRKSVEEYQQASYMPLIFQQDYEMGVGMQGMTPFPKEMALGATDSEEMAYNYGKSVGLECRSWGSPGYFIHVADLN